MTGGWAEGIPQSLKPVVYFQMFAARLKSCPDTKRFLNRVFPQPVKPALILRIYGTAEAVPFQNLADRGQGDAERVAGEGEAGSG